MLQFDRYYRGAAAALLACASPVMAQAPFTRVTTYEISKPTGDTRGFLSHPSFIGLSWEARWAATPWASAGFLLGLNEYSERFTGTTNFPSGAATGQQFRYLLSTPVLVTAYAYPFRTGALRWYVGGGAGTTRIDQTYELGVQQVQRGAWHFTATPEVGTEIYAFGDDFIGVIGVRYNMSAATGDYVGGGARRFRSFSIRIGVGER